MASGNRCGQKSKAIAAQVELEESQFGNALMELDRLVARPSIEFTVEAETPILKCDVDRGDE
jgi:hypothetical protein